MHLGRLYLLGEKPACRRACRHLALEATRGTSRTLPDSVLGTNYSLGWPRIVSCHQRTVILAGMYSRPNWYSLILCASSIWCAHYYERFIASHGCGPQHVKAGLICHLSLVQTVASAKVKYTNVRGGNLMCQFTKFDRRVALGTCIPATYFSYGEGLLCKMAQCRMTSLAM